MLTINDKYISSDGTRHRAFLFNSAWYATWYPFPDTPLNHRQAKIAIYLAQAIEQGLSSKDPNFEHLSWFAEEFHLSLDQIASYVKDDGSSE